MFTFRTSLQIFMLMWISLLTLQSAEAARSTRSSILPPKHEISFHFRGLDSNAGGVRGMGLRYRYKMVEFMYSTIGGLGIAVRKDLNEYGFFVPHMAVGVSRFTGYTALMGGMGLNLRLIRLFGIEWGVRMDTYAAVLFPRAIVYPIYTLGVAIAF